MRRLPSLHALRAFEAAARLGAFNRAADELNVSPTAISHHIRGLELDIGVPLFDRIARGIRLTEKGDRLARAGSDAFNTLERAIEDIRVTNERPVITLAVGPILASRWLSARLSALWDAFPEIELRILRTPYNADPAEVGADICIAWGNGEWRGVETVPFLTVSAFPVASPDLLERYGTPKSPEELMSLPLIHESDGADWGHWFRSRGISAPDRIGGVRIEDSNVLLRSCIDGQGVALGWIPFIQPEIDAGTLMRLFDQGVPTSRAYHLCLSRRTAFAPLRARLAEWLLDQRDC